MLREEAKERERDGQQGASLVKERAGQQGASLVKERDGKQGASLVSTGCQTSGRGGSFRYCTGLSDLSTVLYTVQSQANTLQ